MDRKILALLSGVMLFAGYLALKKSENVVEFYDEVTQENESTNILEAPSQEINYFYLDIPQDTPERDLTLTEKIKEFFSPKLSAQEVDGILTNQNVKAFIVLIRTGEGTKDQGGYSRLYGGGAFFGFEDHPRIFVTRNGIKSSAAGAYQILSRTWDDIRKSNSFLTDFSPHNQDRAAIVLIHRRGALNDVINGNFADAIVKTNREWASLPGSPYGQPTLTLTKAFQILAANGGETGVG
jgi:muramidase (phage lysozyme)